MLFFCPAKIIMAELYIEFLYFKPFGLPLPDLI